MTRRRFYAPLSAFSADGGVELVADEARHLKDVLRLEHGDEVFVFDGIGHEFRCTISQLRRDFASLSILSEVEPARPESDLRLTLALALLKGEKFDWVVQKATELGVERIVPTITARADIRLRDVRDAEKRVARWQRIGQEAAKQSGRARVPEVSLPEEFCSILSITDREIGLMFSEREGQTLSAAIGNVSLKPVIALIGSEGGWADNELVSARNAGWKIVTLGGRILRAETAAIVATTLLQSSLGDLK